MQIRSRAVGIVSTLALIVAGVGLAAPASADNTPPDGTPATVSADPLPTVQVDGVVWAQQVIGNKVYVAGSFATARPAGAAAGVNTVTRANLLAYDIGTGVLDATFAPVLNAQALALAASPDGSVLYVGGSFTDVNGSVRSRIAAFSTATGALLNNFRPLASTTVRALHATATTVYAGGDFTAMSGVARPYAAAMDAATGAVLEWNPAPDAPVLALTMNHSGSKAILGGRFTAAGGLTGIRGLAAVDPVTGAAAAWEAPTYVRNSGTEGAITALASDEDGVYGAGYTFGRASGNLEGAFMADGETGALDWVEDCHGDTYSIYPQGDIYYAAGHKHYCGNVVNGYMQTNPWTYYHSTAFTKTAKGTLGREYLGYFNWEGQPSPALLHWFPSWTIGAITGQDQAVWSVTGNDDYVVYGGEFPRVNTTNQQGLVRFARQGIGTKTVGPNSNNSLTPSVVSYKAGEVRVGWLATHDRDNEALTYRVYRNFRNLSDTPIYEVTVDSRFDRRQQMSFVDKSATIGQAYNYRVYAFDGNGNSASRAATTVTVSDGSVQSPYLAAVLDDQPTTYYRFGEAAGATSAIDTASADNATPQVGVTFGAAGALAGDADTAATFDGTSTGGYASAQVSREAPNTFSVEAWFNTTTTAGGRIVGYSDAAEGRSGSVDRMIYMDNTGRIHFGVRPSSRIAISSTGSYNDGQWHHVVATLGSTGMRLYIDGQSIASRGDVTTGQKYTGQWRVGGDQFSSWPSTPTSRYFAGAIDEVAVYPTVLNRQQVTAHYAAAGATVSVPEKPADGFGAAVYDRDPDLFWRLDETEGSTAQDAGLADNDGNVTGGVTWGEAGALTGPTGTAAQFNGTDGLVVANRAVISPTVYSAGVWFKTTTTTGGKLMGFGNAATGLSTNYDRHIYMQDDGKVVFGTYTGVQNTITSASAYNDGAWHQALATQGPDGLKLYLDGELVGTNPVTTAQAYTGYWRLGGDNTWGSTSRYFAGTLDDAVVLSSVLDASTVADLYALGSGHVNQPPTADFTATANLLDVHVDGTASSDPDGSISSYSWNFGDGSPEVTGATADHTYAAGGTYQVTLTVTDGKGAQATVTKDVVAEAPNQAPTAAFTATPTKLSVAFDASGSTDSDGTVDSFAWNFGDGENGTGASPTHVYSAAGTYTVELTVTDNDGTTGTVSHDVTVVANVKPTAAFTATPTNLTAAFDASGSTDSDGTVDSYAWSFGDGENGTGTTPDHVYSAAGTFTVELTITDNDGATDTVSHDVTVTEPPANQDPTAAFTSTPTDLSVAFDGSGSSDSDGTVDGYAWDFGDGDNGTGQTPTHVYTAAGTYTVELTVTDDDGATDTVSHDVTVTAPPANAAFATDGFARTVGTGWGTADLGGAWSVTSPSSAYSVSGGVGRMTLNTAGGTLAASLNTVSQTSTDLTMQVAFDKAQTGGGTYLYVVPRRVSNSTDYRATVRFEASGAVSARLSSVVNNTDTILVRTTSSLLSYTPGQKVNIRVQATGTSPTTLRVKVWADGSAEPSSWALSTTDSTAVLQVPGGIAIKPYLSASSTSTPLLLTVDNLDARPVQP